MALGAAFCILDHHQAGQPGGFRINHDLLGFVVGTGAMTGFTADAFAIGVFCFLVNNRSAPRLAFVTWHFKQASSCCGSPSPFPEAILRDSPEARVSKALACADSVHIFH